ncbi:ATP-binding protein, partial [Myxococcota bacterium]|nr:ATP-binding protein [Myxococcota bacterium]
RARLQRAERVAAWREIARRVAHEIKNPLFPIQMSMETLRKSWRSQHPKLEEIVEESTKTVLEEVRSLNRIVTEFSDFARLPSPKLEETSVLDVLEHAAALWASGAPGAAPIEVVLDRDVITARALPRIAIDRGQIERALINLVKNAVEVLRDSGGRVTLDAHAEVRGARSGVVLTVHDTGPGIPDELRERIFTPYFTTKAEGTGLGLAIVERIAEEHHGAVHVDSAPGRGTTFHLWLPGLTGYPAE